MERDYKKDVQINKFSLDEECSQHADIYLHWAKLANDAKNNVEKTEARIEMFLRGDALKNKGILNNGIKATADAIKAQFRPLVWQVRSDKEGLRDAAVAEFPYRWLDGGILQFRAMRC